MVNCEKAMFTGVVNCALTPPLALLVEPIPADALRSMTTTRSTPARRSCSAMASPTAPAPTTTTRARLPCAVVDAGSLAGWRRILYGVGAPACNCARGNPRIEASINSTG
jgi:hypothetical protein